MFTEIIFHLKILLLILNYDSSIIILQAASKIKCTLSFAGK